MINKVILIGNLGKDPEIKHFENGGVIAKFPLATNENYRDKTGEWQTITDWHNIVLRGGAAERSERNLHKGNTIYVEGKIRTRKWQDANGNDHYTTEIIAISYRILNRKENTDESTQISNSDNSTDNTNDSASKGANPGDVLPF
jgi:single-strand DNA-binding protein